MRNIKIYICIVILFIIQISCSDLIDIKGCIPNILLVFCICFSVTNGITLSGLIESAVCGILCDIAGSLPWGTSVILFMAIYLLCAFTGNKFYRAQLPISMAFAAIITFIYESIGYLVMFMQGSHVSYALSIYRTIMPVCIYHVILAFIMFLIVHRFIGEKSLLDGELE